jgi:hypothetical protein
MAEKVDKAGSWWLTLPGLLTGAAAVVTAVTGLLLGLHQVGWIGADDASGSKGTTPPPVAVGTPPAADATTPSATANAGVDMPAGEGFAVDIPLNESVKSGTVAYSVSAATAEPDIDRSLRLSFTVRAVNSGRYDLGLWDRSFRVVVGGDSYAPTSGLDKIVHGDSTGTGQVDFVIPADTTDAKLVFRFLEGDRSVPFAVKASAG